MGVSCLLLGVDGGSRETLNPFDGLQGFKNASCSDGRAKEREYWRDMLSSYDALVLGTSDSNRGRLIEQAAQEAATELEKPVIVLEDYPGNYRHTNGLRIDVLVVASEFERKLHKSHLGKKAPAIITCMPARFDIYKRNGLQERLEYKKRRDCYQGALRVLWAGQPETDDAVETLQRLLPAFAENRVEVLFKSHPRDQGYKTGAYSRFLTNKDVCFHDVTSMSLSSCMKKTPALLATQFSSMALEAGFFGLPSMHVLYKDIGGKRLEQKKGFSVPPWCAVGASFLVATEESQRDVIGTALTSQDARAAVLEKFDHYFGFGSEMLPMLVELIQKTALSCGK